MATAKIKIRLTKMAYGYKCAFGQSNLRWLTREENLHRLAAQLPTFELVVD